MIAIALGYNDLTSNIPNSALYSQIIRNLSRGRKCQVLQTIRIDYSDIPKIDSIVADIKEEVKKACPALITVGRPFRASLRDFQDDHVTVVCDFHFNLPPAGDMYWENRQKVLQAIDRAIRKNGCNVFQVAQFTGDTLNKRNY